MSEQTRGPRRMRQLRDVAAFRRWREKVSSREVFAVALGLGSSTMRELEVFGNVSPKTLIALERNGVPVDLLLSDPAEGRRIKRTGRVGFGVSGTIADLDELPDP